MTQGRAAPRLLVALLLSLAALQLGSALDDVHLQELTRGYAVQGVVARVEANGGLSGLTQARVPVVLTNTDAMRWRAMDLWTPQHFCIKRPSDGADDADQASVPVFKHTERIFTWFTEANPMADLAALAWRPPHEKTRRSLCAFWREAHPALFDLVNASSNPGMPLAQLQAERTVDHQASLGTAGESKAGEATASSYMYLSCPLTTFPELAQDIQPFRFMVLPREWQPPLAAAATTTTADSRQEAEGTESDSAAIDSSRHDINLWMGTAGVTAQTHYDCSHNLYVQVHGNKSFILSPPSEHAKLHLFPELHPSRRQSQVDFLAPDDVAARAFPGFDHNITGYQADMGPGDVLYIPPFWFHRVMATSEDSISVNMWSTSKEEDVYNEIEYHTPIPFDSEWSDAKVRIALREYILLLARHHLADVLDVSSSTSAPSTPSGGKGKGAKEDQRRAKRFIERFVGRSYAPLFADRDGCDEFACDPTTDAPIERSERKKLATWAKSKVLEERLDRGARRVVDLLAELSGGDAPSVRELLLLRYIETVANYFLGTDRVHRFFLSCFSATAA